MKNNKKNAKSKPKPIKSESGNENKIIENENEIEIERAENDNINAQYELRKINDANGFYEFKNENENENVDDDDNYIEDENDLEVDYIHEIESDESFVKKIKYSESKFTPKKKRMRYFPIHILAFVIPCILMLIAYRSTKIFPFGDRQIMVVDSWHQYYPFLQELQSKLTSSGSLLYSWNTGAGTNFLTLMAYYASTPLYLFSVFFPQEYLREFMMIVTVVKIACSGLFFSIYLRGMHIHDFRRKTNSTESKKFCSIGNGLIVLGFSILYAVSAYAVGYYWCLMWLDCMALLPLVILGLERFIDSGKYKLYIIALGVTVICNYYIAIFVCEFIAVYYVVLYFIKIKNPTFKGFLIKTAKVVGASIVGVGLSMFILLPTYLWFSNTGNSGSTFSRDITTYNSLLDIITNMLPNTKPAVRAGLPNIACGMIVVVMAGLYFLNSKIRIREKLLIGGFLTFMLFSFNINILDYYWHGLHFPNEIPYRQAFVFTFVLVTIAYKSYMTMDGENLKKGMIWKLGLGVFGYLIIAEQWYKSSDKFDFKVFYVAIAFLLVYMTLILLFKNGKMPKSYLAVILMFAMVFEGGMSAIKGAATTGTSDRNVYAPSKENIQKTVKDIYESDDELFYRLEMNRWYTTNDPALYGYRGISQFSSESNSKFARTLEILGIAASIPSNRFLYSSSTPVFNMMMSIKYLMSREDEKEHSMNSVAFSEYIRNATQDENEGFDTKAVMSYKSNYWLPLGFFVLEDIQEINVDEPNVFITQNEFMKKSTGVNKDVFNSIQQTSNTNVNLNESHSSYGMYTYVMKDKAQKGVVNHVYTAEKTEQVYIYIKSTRTPNAEKAVISINGTKKNYEVGRGMTIDCGIVNEGQEINVSFNIPASESGSYNVFVVGFDSDTFVYQYDILNQNTFNIEHFEDTNIKGTISVDEDGLFFTSIPYDKGWHLKIDGKEVEINPKSAAEINDVSEPDKNDKDAKDKKKVDERLIKKITEGFVTAPITEGEHTIELYYITDGLVPGLCISVLCIGIIIALEFLTRYLKKRKYDREVKY